jgi:hypothetical protein
MHRVAICIAISCNALAVDLHNEGIMQWFRLRRDITEFSMKALLLTSATRVKCSLSRQTCMAQYFRLPCF